jgi:hypothetical protein
VTEDSEIASCVHFGANRFLTLPLSVQFFTNGGVTPIRRKRATSFCLRLADHHRKYTEQFQIVIVVGSQWLWTRSVNLPRRVFDFKYEMTIPV